MLNFVWVFMVVVGILVGIATGRQEAIVNAVLNSAKNSAAMIIGLIGIYVFWMGILNIAKDSGIVDRLAARLKKVLMFLFPDVPPNSEAAGYMSLNLVANILGMGNAATPFGLSAMRELDKLNGHRTIASNAMVMFLVINASSIQLLPLTLIAIRGAYGSANPADIVLPSLITTGVSTLAAIVLAKIMERRY